jgi:hypothetical protein
LRHRIDSLLHLFLFRQKTSTKNLFKGLILSILQCQHIGYLKRPGKNSKEEKRQPGYPDHRKLRQSLDNMKMFHISESWLEAVRITRRTAFLENWAAGCSCACLTLNVNVPMGVSKSGVAQESPKSARITGSKHFSGKIQMLDETMQHENELGDVLMRIKFHEPNNDRARDGHLRITHNNNGWNS